MLEDTWQQSWPSTVKTEIVPLQLWQAELSLDIAKCSLGDKVIWNSVIATYIHTHTALWVRMTPAPCIFYHDKNQNTLDHRKWKTHQQGCACSVRMQRIEASMAAQQVKPLPAKTQADTNAGSSPSCSASRPDRSLLMHLRRLPQTAQGLPTWESGLDIQSPGFGPTPVPVTDLLGNESALENSFFCYSAFQRENKS